MSPFGKREQKRRAVTGVFVCVSMVGLLGFAALSVDVSYIYASRAEMQSAVDAGALAGASGTPISVSTAIARGTHMACANKVAGSRLLPPEVSVEVGYWDGINHVFSLPTGGEKAHPNAARVVGTRTGVNLFFAPVIGHDTVNISKMATAVQGGGVCNGIWGLTGIDGDGSLVTDSYYSSAGLYGPGNIYLEGDICSNQDIVLEGGVDVGGDAMHGEGYDLDIYGSSYAIAGVTGPQHGSVSIPPIDMAGAQANNDNATIPLTDVKHFDPFAGTMWDLIGVTGWDTLTLNGGTYYLTSAVLEGGAQIIVTAPTTIYVDGPAEFAGGGIINLTRDPQNLTIYSTGSTLDIAGNAAFYGQVIAPNATVTFTGTSDIYGVVLADFLQLYGDTRIHVDTDSLLDVFDLHPNQPVLVQ